MLTFNKEDIGKVIEIRRKVSKNENIFYKGYLVEILEDSLKLKLLDNGYNVGILIKEIADFKFIDIKIELGKVKTINLKENPALPKVAYIGTGGTIGTHVDYVTGGVTMCRTAQEVISTTPEISEIINLVKIESPFSKASEDINYKDWQLISQLVYDNLINKDIDGIIITHGTDTLSFTGTALSFMLENINKPVVLVGAQKSPDRASFDGAFNLMCASHFIKEKIPGVFIVMHGSINDDFCLAIKAVKSRKMHTSRRDAFKPVNSSAVCKIYANGKIEFLSKKESLDLINAPVLYKEFEEKVALLKIYPNIDPSIIDWYINKDYKGIVIEGTGLGHVPTGEGLDKISKEYQFLPFIKKAIDKGIIVVMASQCLFGRVNGKVYANLRLISKEGVEYLESHDMLPEVLQIKLSVALKKFKEKEKIINYLKTNVSGEISSKEIPSDYFL